MSGDTALISRTSKRAHPLLVWLAERSVAG
jgi:hypothetical protein